MTSNRKRNKRTETCQTRKILSRNRWSIMSQNVTISVRWISNDDNFDVFFCKLFQCCALIFEDFHIGTENENVRFRCVIRITSYLSKSFRSIPSFRGMAPTNNATSTSLNAISSLSVATTPKFQRIFSLSLVLSFDRSPLTSDKLKSSISMITPFKTPIIGEISNR